MMNQNQNDMNAFKYCRIKKKKGFNGYGFNLQSKSDAKCRYVGIVDACSPACLANLKNGDYIDEECGFLPPPKSVSDPRLFLVKSNQAIEFSNKH